MARGMFSGKLRSPQATAGSISNPVLKYTDALPRTDLRDIENVANTSRPANRAVAQWDFQRPRIADTRNLIRKGAGPTPGFDFRVAVPPDEALPSPQTSEHDPNVNMIGIALGSPRMIEPQTMLSQMEERPPVPSTKSPEQTPPLQRKPSKWRKIGGLFKAKNAMTPDANQPFYQVRCGEEWPFQESTHSIDSQNQEKVKHAPEAPSHAEVWPCFESENDSKDSNNSNQSATAIQDLTRDNQLVPAAKLRCAGPLLHVDIPDVQLERYSVMFGGLLNKNEPSLLNRRSKTLDDITIPTQTETSSLASPDLPLPQRRATSPRPRLPNFNLFPAQAPVSKASKVLGSQNIPRGVSPVHRSQNSLSQSGSVTPTNEQSRFVLMVHSPSVKSPMSHQPKDSVSSAISSDPIDPAEEQRLLERLKQTKAYVNTEEEPEWEIISKNLAKEMPTSTSTPITNLHPVPIPAPKQRFPLALTINTQVPPSEAGSADPASASASASAASSPLLSPLNSATRERTERMRSVSRSSSRSPAPQSAISHASSTRMPLSDENDSEETDTIERIDSIPKIEVSIARSMSISRGKKQILVPIGPRPDRLSPDERLVVRRAKTPQVRDAHYGHRHGNSQDAQIETI
ncbi:uncharacterized protein ACLA_055560 [Aspergillus clavatus NRRL 1]|uniref:Uncharacterized protein n=1 Tax=Aspergillus clavatus (strain ATCC 1007 / CBS 513.65 / DSM 816 / NCTC 3887 / NRRL 1 / QM 1276 / 107) TaxID=344612 RepID=A1C9I4_ASPCL|nr:uncharacterized protein ACLA_055560 [Aspergillus clavatus NRRL 1]EAW13508.1 conserved hypothetical protein [Aspergillus clavatus NRRL 1]